jgi:alpha-glucosidase
MTRSLVFVVVVGVVSSTLAPPAASARQDAGVVREAPPVVAPAASFFEKFPEADRDAARAFYRKVVDVNGLTVAASGDVADEALLRTHEIVTRMLAGRPDVLAAMARHGTRLIVIGKDQVYTDMPEYRNHPDPAYQNERVRGTGGLGVTSFGEENLLNLAGDRYDDESIGVHEFCHTIDAALRTIDPGWRQRLNDTYRAAMDKGLWKNAYAASNPAEYWAEVCQSYFDCNRVNNWNHNSVGTREQLKRYDPAAYELVKTTFKLTPEQDWRFRPLRVQPSVVPPPSRLKLDPYYTKFTYAREFPVMGSGRVSDEAMLKANDTVRKMFAYRHDVLKAMINDGARLVVLARGEPLSDLPELKGTRATAAADNLRCLDYTPELKLMVVPEENLRPLPGDPPGGEAAVVAAFARAMHAVTASRPADPDFDRRPRKQQYELRVKRLDVEFDQRLQKLFDSAAAKGLWKGTPAARDRVEYWAAGVLAYFDAAGTGFAPNGAERPVTTRESLKAYDPDLYALVDETMAYKEHVDWRYGPSPR